MLSALCQHKLYCEKVKSQRKRKRKRKRGRNNTQLVMDKCTKEYLKGKCIRFGYIFTRNHKKYKETIYDNLQEKKIIRRVACQYGYP